MKNNNRVSDLYKGELTYERLKTFKGFEDITEIEAEEQIKIIKRIAKILYYLYMNEGQQNKEREQQ